jgi:hypothetical protein
VNCHNVAKHCKFDARGTAVHNTATASTCAVEIKMATFTERARVCFGSPSIIRMMKSRRMIGGAYSANRETGNAYRLLAVAW